MAVTEPCYVAECLYARDAAGKRAPFREAHLTRLAMLSDEGALLLAGAFDDPYVNLESVAGSEVRNVVAQLGAVDEIGAVHDRLPVADARK